MHNFKQLDIWNDGIDLVVDIYKLLETFPKEEIYGLAAQMKRSGVSIPSNIAEGSGRGTDKDFSRFLDYSVGSSCELDTQLVVANRLGWVDKEIYSGFQDRIDHLQKRIFRLQQRFDE